MLKTHTAYELLHDQCPDRSSSIASTHFRRHQILSQQAQLVTVRIFLRGVTGRMCDDTYPEVHDAQAIASCSKSNRHLLYLLHSICFWAGCRYIGVYIAISIGGCADWISHKALKVPPGAAHQIQGSGCSSCWLPLSKTSNLWTLGTLLQSRSALQPLPSQLTWNWLSPVRLLAF